MITFWYKSWIRCGITSKKSGNVSSKRTLNTITLLLILTLITQISVSIGDNSLNIPWWTSVQFFQLLGLASLPLSYLSFGYQATRNLVLLILVSIIFMQFLLQSPYNLPQHYALFAVLVCFYTIDEHEKTLLLSCVVGFSVLFIIANLVQTPWLTGANNNWMLLQTGIFLVCYLTLQFHIKRSHFVSLKKVQDLHSFSDHILAKTLPKAIVPKIQVKPDGFAEHYPHCTILFADLHNFTTLCKTHSAEDLIALLNTLFGTFDKLAVQHDVHRIKTNGDEYVLASGVLEPSNEHAKRCCEFALAMRQAFIAYNRTHQLNLGIRIGIASGEIMAGVIGKQSYNFDVWGETVNLASRMETNADINNIFVSPGTYVSVKNEFNFKENPVSQIKGFGKLKTYRLIN